MDKPPCTGEPARHEKLAEVLQIFQCEQHLGTTSGSEVPEHIEKRVKFFHIATWNDRTMYPLLNRKVLNTETVPGRQFADKSANLYSQAEGPNK